MHWWDEIVADRYVCALSFGFATLIVNPQAGSGDVSCDGRANRGGVDEAFSTIRAGAGNGSLVSEPNLSLKITAEATTDRYAILNRVFASFSTSALGVTAQISAVVIALYLSSKENDLGSSDLYIVASTQAAANTIDSSDYALRGSTSFGTATYASLTASAYNNITLNASGEAAISKTSVTKLALLLGFDFLNVAPTWADSLSTDFVFNAADNASNKPKLTITYTVPTLATEITDATDATEIEVTTAVAHGLSTGQAVYIYGVLGNTCANGFWTIRVTSTTKFKLIRSVGCGTYTGGGKIRAPAPERVNEGIISGATNASPIVITTSTDHNINTGDTVEIKGVRGNSAANGNWTATKVSNTTLSLDDSTGSGSYTSGGIFKGGFSPQVQSAMSIPSRLRGI